MVRRKKKAKRTNKLTHQGHTHRGLKTRLTQITIKGKVDISIIYISSNLTAKTTQQLNDLLINYTFSLLSISFSGISLTKGRTGRLKFEIDT